MSSPAKKFKVLVTQPAIRDVVLDLLKEECEVTLCSDMRSTRSEILEKSKGMDGIIWGTHEKLNAEALDAAGPSLRAISTVSAGMDYVDIPEVKRRGIKLGHTPKVLDEAVADIAIGLMISAARRFHEGLMKIESSEWENWNPRWLLGQDIVGATVGFVGFGGIGQAIARRLRGFDVGKIIYYSRNPNPNGAKYNAWHVQFDELLKQSDFVIIACPLTDSTREMFNESAFNQMKSNCVLVNIARGQIVNQKDLYNALKNGKIFSAGLDVMTPEPLPKDDPLLTLPNCVVIPHLGSATFRTRKEMATAAVKNLLNGLTGVPMVYPAYE